MTQAIQQDKPSVGAAKGARGAKTSTPPKRNPEIARVLGINVPVSVVLAERDLPIESILQITVGTILEFEVSFGAELTLLVGNRPVGRGAAVKIGEHFGLRVTGIESVRQRIDALGGG